MWPPGENEFDTPAGDCHIVAKNGLLQNALGWTIRMYCFCSSKMARYWCQFCRTKMVEYWQFHKVWTLLLSGWSHYPPPDVSHEFKNIPEYSSRKQNLSALLKLKSKNNWIAISHLDPHLLHKNFYPFTSLSSIYYIILQGASHENKFLRNWTWSSCFC